MMMFLLMAAMMPLVQWRRCSWAAGRLVPEKIDNHIVRNNEIYDCGSMASLKTGKQHIVGWRQ